MKEPSLNTYGLPVDVPLDVRAAPFHYENDWLKNAVDFAINPGHRILATLDGVVHEVKDGFGDGGPDLELLGNCNLVIIEHPNDEFSLYAHLQRGIFVSEGQHVQRGQVIGLSGNSGYTTYPHLHYHTMCITDGVRQTIPTKFNIDGEIKVLVSPRE